MDCYKLTDINGITRNNTKWGPNITHEVSGIGPLCSKGWLHAYKDPSVALFMNPIHASFNPVRLWKSLGEGHVLEEPLKIGFSRLTTLEELEISVITTNNRIAFGIYCALEVYTEPSWVAWANNWLNGINRSYVNANAAANIYAAASTTYAAANAAAAATNAAYAAYAAYAANAAYAAANAAYAASAAAAAYAANNAAKDFSTLAKKAMLIS